MAKVTGGLFSLKARKTLKKVITFQGLRGTNIVTKHHKPGDKSPFTPSGGQVFQRARIASLVAGWQSLSSQVKGAWNEYAKLIRYIGTGYHYFIYKGGIVGLLGDVRIAFGSYIAKVTSDGWLETRGHTSDKCFGQDYAEAQTDEVIITPTEGKKIRIVQVYVSTNVEVVNVTLKFTTSEDIFFKLYTGKKQAQTGNIICGEGAVDETVQLTCGAGTFISISYDEVDP